MLAVLVKTNARWALSLKANAIRLTPISAPSAVPAQAFAPAELSPSNSDKHKKKEGASILLDAPSFHLVRRMRLELTRSCDHYPLKVACIPISPPALSKQRPSLPLCPEQDSNLHTSRHAHLKRTRLPIPPSGLPVTSLSKKSRHLTCFER